MLVQEKPTSRIPRTQNDYASEFIGEFKLTSLIYGLPVDFPGCHGDVCGELLFLINAKVNIYVNFAELGFAVC